MFRFPLFDRRKSPPMPRFLTDDKVTLIYDDLGPREGQPVLFCHGLAASGAQHAADAAFFAERGYRVLVPDMRGHGRSGKPRFMNAAGFAIRRMANDLLQLLDHAEIGPVHWVGNSLGGILGLELLGRRAEQFRTFATFGSPYALRLPRSAAYAIPLAYALFGPEHYATLAAYAMSREPPARRLIASVVRKWDPEVGRLAALDLTRYDLIANALAAPVPILMLRGGRDPQVNVLLGPTLRAMRRRTNFTLVDVPEGGHCANLDAPDRVRTELLRFWQTAGD